MEKTRNFCIIAHVDHGKSTLADRIIQACGGVADRDFRDQVLDSMDIERERGITIKSNTVTLSYGARDGETYRLNLIDTPGHVDFSHEVRRSLMSCEGALLVIDASQGVEAQTVANLYVAMEYDLAIVPVINKIDLPAADVERVAEEIDADLGLDPFESIHCSAKNNTGIDDVLEAIVTKLPAPKGTLDAPLKALIFDAQYDPYRGVVIFLRVMDGAIRPGQRIRLMHTEKDYVVEEVGRLQLRKIKTKELTAGDVGYLIGGIKTVRDIAIGDTMTDAGNPASEALPGYREAKSVVFSSLYPISSEDYEDLSRALDKLALNDAALTFQKTSSSALGFGFRCGFLGLLHLEVVQERLEREYGMSLLLSAPSVLYKVTTTRGELIDVDNPSLFPDAGDVESVEEPFIKASIIIPEKYLGATLELCREQRSENTRFDYLSVGRIEVLSEMPLGEVLFDFYDHLKTVTRGYGSFDYELLDYRPTRIAKVDILVNKEKVDALSQLVHADKARMRALHYCEQLAKTIPKHQFKIPIQGAIGGNVIARTTINAFRKDVTAKCYGGDITRKRKLLEKQKKGKRKMKMIGSVEIPQEAFIAVLRTDKEK
ncbi:MAG: translation elongation factor 4 [Planctomycetota bacterium]|nr:translation elongation factor 4 [Planctomycetota bacterium]